MENTVLNFESIEEPAACEVFHLSKIVDFKSSMERQMSDMPLIFHMTILMFGHIIKNLSMIMMTMIDRFILAQIIVIQNMVTFM